MVKKTVGYVELEWTCPQCGTRNPGTVKMCTSCSRAQPERVEFDQAAEEKLIEDREEIARAEAGPDVHCAFCGARNPAGAERCTQCGADLTSAEARESGRVMGAHRVGPAAPVTCPQCGAQNPATATRCAQCNASLPRASAAPKPLTQTPSTAGVKGGRKLGLLAILGIGAAALAAIAVCVIVVLALIPSRAVVGQVQSVQWERSIEIEALTDVRHEDWRDEIPAQGQIQSCTQKHRSTQDSPASNATEVCGTPYTVDTGTGVGKVVQDCEYHVYDDWCTYAVQEWRRADTATASGNDYDPRWPGLRLGGGQREGDRVETYKVLFQTEDKTYTYTTSSLDQFRECQIGSRWKLKINVLGGVKSIEPAG
ncbi:MAG TPA: zinc ribbon domain-containing protein [Anaerolineae bacterium]|nr:zinc ribbon domain-containing protein [Anaerolineae bacterium]